MIQVYYVLMIGFFMSFNLLYCGDNAISATKTSQSELVQEGTVQQKDQDDTFVEINSQISTMSKSYQNLGSKLSKRSNALQELRTQEIERQLTTEEKRLRKKLLVQVQNTLNNMAKCEKSIKKKLEHKQAYSELVQEGTVQQKDQDDTFVEINSQISTMSKSYQNLGSKLSKRSNALQELRTQETERQLTTKEKRLRQELLVQVNNTLNNMAKCKESIKKKLEHKQAYKELLDFINRIDPNFLPHEYASTDKNIDDKIHWINLFITRKQIEANKLSAHIQQLNSHIPSETKNDLEQDFLIHNLEINKLHLWVLESDIADLEMLYNNCFLAQILKLSTQPNLTFDQIKSYTAMIARWQESQISLSSRINHDSTLLDAFLACQAQYKSNCRFAYERLQKEPNEKEKNKLHRLLLDALDSQIEKIAVFQQSRKANKDEDFDLKLSSELAECKIDRCEFKRQQNKDIRATLSARIKTLQKSNSQEALLEESIQKLEQLSSEMQILNKEMAKSSEALLKMGLKDYVSQFRTQKIENAARRAERLYFVRDYLTKKPHLSYHQRSWFYNLSWKSTDIFASPLEVEEALAELSEEAQIEGLALYEQRPHTQRMEEIENQPAGVLLKDEKSETFFKEPSAPQIARELVRQNSWWFGTRALQEFRHWLDSCSQAYQEALSMAEKKKPAFNIAEATSRRLSPKYQHSKKGACLADVYSDDLTNPRSLGSLQDSTSPIADLLDNCRTTSGRLLVGVKGRLFPEWMKAS